MKNKTIQNAAKRWRYQLIAAFALAATGLLTLQPLLAQTVRMNSRQSVRSVSRNSAQAARQIARTPANAGADIARNTRQATRQVSRNSYQSARQISRRHFYTLPAGYRPVTYGAYRYYYVGGLYYYPYMDAGTTVYINVDVDASGNPIPPPPASAVL